MKYLREHRMIISLARKVIQYVDARLDGPREVSLKTHAKDVVSDLDIGVDRLIARELRRRYPSDVKVSEESSPELFSRAMAGERTWVVDPLCGSMNVERGIRWFATNVALVAKGRVVAAWVVDHSRRGLIWSVGQGVSVDAKPVKRLSRALRPNSTVEIDFGYLFLMNKKIRTQYFDMARDAFGHPRLSVRKLGSSLGFSYIATGQIDGAMTVNVYPWDLLAPCFLIEQNGGVVTNFDGSPWTLRSKSVVMAGNKELRRMLLRLIKKNHLSEVI